MHAVTRPSRRGNAMLVGLSMGVLLGFSALAVDIGLIRVATTELQAAIDSAAFSGSTELDGSVAGIARARSRALQVAGLNVMLGDAVGLTIAEVQVGNYVPSTDVFTLWDEDPLTVDPLTVDKVNAVQIDHVAPQIGSALGQVAFGVVGYTVTARSMSTRPLSAGTAVTTSCFLPLAVPDCWVADTPAGTNPAPFTFLLTNSNVDSVAWGDPDANPNTNAVNEQLEGQCDQGEVEVGDPIYVNEGSHTSALQTIQDILNDMSGVDPTQWDASLYGAIPARDASSSVAVPRYGNTLEGPVALVDAGTDCANVDFTGSKPMTGIAWAVIYDVKVSGSVKYVKVQLDLVNDHEIWGEIDEDEEGNVLGTGTPMLVDY
jgi:hypothetical protein